MTTLLLALMLLAPGLKAQWTGYIGFEALNLTAQQKVDFLDGLKALGRKNDSPFPNLRNHWRIRLDNNVIICEAEFDDTTITAEALGNRLAALYGVNPTLVTYTTTSTAYGPSLTYRYSNQNRIRVVVFGGLTATWVESRLAALQYVLDSQSDPDPAKRWEPVQ